MCITVPVYKQRAGVFLMVNASSGINSTTLPSDTARPGRDGITGRLSSFRLIAQLLKDSR
jgi:hypothetical protein